MHALSEIFQAPDPSNIEKFFGRLPIIFNVVLFSVHGYFGQADVLGLPDTGGQVKVLDFFFSLFLHEKGLKYMHNVYVSCTGGLCFGSSGCFRRGVAS